MIGVSKQSRWVAASVFCALLAVTSSVQAEANEQVCRFFSSFAFEDRKARAGTTLPMNLAQDCVDATVYARSEDRVVRLRAERYLADLDAYRRVLVGMLVARAREREPRLHGIHIHVRPVVQPLSWVGSYLIAREMGLVERHEDWTAWRRSLASTDPRLRLE